MKMPVTKSYRLGDPSSSGGMTKTLLLFDVIRELVTHCRRSLTLLSSHRGEFVRTVDSVFGIYSYRISNYEKPKDIAGKFFVEN
uniref:Uncharacterized protein n=1 Tax=Romanomermis culicivorax TaxID=13658 RepID=A0A915JMP1_ROMCU